MSDGERYLQLYESGLSYGEIAFQCGVTRNVVAGAIRRARPIAERGIRDPAAAKGLVQIAEKIGFTRAALLYGVTSQHLYEWRSILDVNGGRGARQRGGFDPAVKRRIIGELKDSTWRAVAKRHGISLATLSAWKREAA